MTRNEIKAWLDNRIRKATEEKRKAERHEEEARIEKELDVIEVHDFIAKFAI